MELLIENNRVVPDVKTACSVRRDMPRTISSLPPRLRMKILFRSEEDFEEEIQRNELYSPVDDYTKDLNGTRRNSVAYQTVSEETFMSADYINTVGKFDGGPRILENYQNKSKEFTPKIALRKSHHEANTEQRKNFPGVISLQNDLVQVDRNIENFGVDNLLPRWYERSLEGNKSICISLQELPKLNNEIFEIIESQNYLHDWAKFTNARRKAQGIFLELLETNLKFCCKENVEMYFWKILYYNAIEYFKKCVKNSPDCIADLVKRRALEIIIEGSNFYENLLNILRTKYSFRADQESFTIISSESKSERLVKITAQKIYLSLGDLARYEEQINGGNTFSKAKEFYHIARKLVPTNGIPYNQLAILAIYSKRKFDAIYYHMRSLTASNPIHSAKESLKVLFDEIRKKYESQLETKALEKRQNSVNSCYKLAPIRKEIWIHPDGSRRLYRITPYSSKQLYYLDEKALKELSCDELFKRLQLSYLCVIGKLFTRIGMENFRQILFQMLSEFKEAIERGSFLYTKQRLLQIILLNIFAIDCNTIGNNQYEDDRVVRNEIKNHAFNVASLMFGIILNHANELLTAFMSVGEKTVENISSADSMKTQLPANLGVLLQAVKIWSDWLALNLTSWMPLPSISNYNLLNEYEMNPWDGFAELITLLSALTRNEEIDVEDIYNSKLEEDIFLEGFSPISLDVKHSSALRLCDDYIVDVVRIRKIIYFGSSFLCHCSPPVLKRIANDGKEFFINIANEACDASADYNEHPEFKEISTEKDSDEIDEDLWNTSFEGDKSILLAENPEVSELIKRKQELEERKKMEEKYQQNLQEILREFGNIIQIEVRPKYLVPDTNCFIDSLQELQIIANEFNYYSLAVPLVVLNELEGLSKGFKPSSLSVLQVSRSKIHHFDEVSSSASKALQFIRSKNFSVKCVTSKGSFLNTSAFTVEEHKDEYQSNDDKILATAFNLGKITAEKSGSHRVVATSVVLLTTDRNLRVKALSKKLPVSELQEFLRWAKMEI